MANNRIRYNWGVCTNRDADGNGTPCECCASKERQRVLASHEFVCRVCKEPLQKVQAPKSFAEKYKGLLIGVAAVAVIGGAGAGIALSGGSKEEKAVEADSVTVAKTDSTAKSGQTSQDTAPSTETPAKETETSGQGTATTSKPATSSKPITTPANGSATTSRSSSAASNDKTSTARNGYGRVNLGYGKYEGELRNGKPHGHGIITYTSSHRIVSSKDFMASPGDTYEGEFRDGSPASIGIWVHDGERTGVKP